jgi:hypothetical protein
MGKDGNRHNINVGIDIIVQTYDTGRGARPRSKWDTEQLSLQSHTDMGQSRDPGWPDPLDQRAAYLHLFTPLTPSQTPTLFFVSRFGSGQQSSKGDRKVSHASCLKMLRPTSPHLPNN